MRGEPGDAMARMKRWDAVRQRLADATQGSENLGTNHTAFQVQDRPVEYYDAALNTRVPRPAAVQPIVHQCVAGSCRHRPQRRAMHSH